MSTAYVLVDFENVQPDLSQLANSPYKVKIFFGAKQQESRVPFKLLDAVMALGGNVEPIKITRSGSNAVDMHIAWYIGGLLEREPDARIHIVSGDTDFDPLLEFLAARGVNCRRTKTLAELVSAKPAKPAPRASAPKAPRNAPPRQPRAPRAKSAPARPTASDKLPAIVKQLRSMNGKPSTRAKLAQTIASYFKHHGGEPGAKVVEQHIDELVRQGLVTQDGKSLKYDLGG
ncbi:MAG TPA: PIN domain-containing protein [Steroidobacteraceae bacterium]|nr:PIN domain-containing protein [Steroidobacteraceae bacterium]